MDNRNYDPMQHIAVDIRTLGLWHLDRYEKRLLNYVTALIIMLVVFGLFSANLFLGVNEIGIFSTI